MDKLINKKYANYDYTSRYINVPYYYDPTTGREIYGIGEQINFNTSYVSHKVKPSDTLDYLALKYLGDCLYWWAIAYFNKINDPFIHLSEHFSTIKIPNISSIEFANSR